MNNCQQTINYSEVLEVIKNMNLTATKQFALTQILTAYIWMSSKDILIDATYKDIVKLFLEDMKTAFLHSSEEKQSTFES